MNYSIEKSLDRILISKNWNNILLRNEIRQDILTSRLNYTNESLDERFLVEYLHNLDNEQLVEIRNRIFKLARDHYFESLIKQKLGQRPVLKGIGQDSFEDSYALKCNLMKDCVECLEFILNQSKFIDQLPQRCTEYQNADSLSFPLGKRIYKIN